MQKPRRSLSDNLLICLLTFALCFAPLLPARMTERFRKSRKKRLAGYHAAGSGQIGQQPPLGWSGLETTASISIADIVRVPFSNIDEGFVPYSPPPAIDPKVKLIAFYLPQFHPFPENDGWWGKGFTEWTNVGKAQPNYVGHYQPHCPIHFGYYDLRVPSVMEDQAKVLKEYGLYGFSYYFYWFGGKILMEEPLKAMLANPKASAPFCFTWANENWTRRWDGMENDVLIAQNHSLEDSLNLLRHFAQYFSDERYIRIDGKPVFIVYRANIIPDINEIVAGWRKEARKLGFPGLYLVAAQSFGILDPTHFGFDAAVEFPPHNTVAGSVVDKLDITNRDFTGAVYDYVDAVDNAITKPEPDYKLFRSAMLSWDNTARKQNASHGYARFSVTSYAQWLSSICHRVLANPKYAADEKIVFINAWNEWAEGTHLEPDRKHGFGYLKATYDVVAELSHSQDEPQPFPSRRKNDNAVLLHVHYDDTWPEINQRLTKLGPHDLFVTTTSAAFLYRVRADRPDAYVELVENRGRDIRPFLAILRRLRPLGYKAVCKIHSKKSTYRADGEKLRRAFLE
ncbi:MAG: glycoside hydrolase family 99-like domain-containing protein, partial [Rhodobacteraceae bacterium]|nr:glycoside hydrolase family 99-like domain-containing protein [Paracoccaceae bacterium]